ncbi:hypothetical protein JYU29_05590 [Tianweitania sp. BSSL-BM11]|uniref:Uncharacterized protein n=1 Tax=Tianweitania aestuarii TaxID=2814886 RepID=A0ABS5RSX2_9HYPH|nr:hypothetical protein [Tianweitania aestuarii]MBS9720158.1 hypothetical protein [Tianweitania aestuarii]
MNDNDYDDHKPSTLDRVLFALACFMLIAAFSGLAVVAFLTFLGHHPA